MSCFNLKREYCRRQKQKQEPKEEFDLANVQSGERRWFSIKCTSSYITQDGVLVMIKAGYKYKSKSKELVGQALGDKVVLLKESVRALYGEQAKPVDAFEIMQDGLFS